MKRFLLPNAGANLKNTQVAIALGIAECEKLGVQDFTVVVGTKENFESTEIGKLLGNILTRSRKLSDEEMLEKLRGVLTQHGRISGILIDEAEDLPSSSAFRNRFGSLVSAYRLIGYDPDIDYNFIEINRQIRKKHPEIMADVMGKLRQMGASIVLDEKTDLIFVNEEWTVSIVLCRYQQTDAGTAR